MAHTRTNCPDCASDFETIDRRHFLKTAGVAVAAGSASLAFPNWAVAKEGSIASKPESIVKTLYDSLKEEQRKKVCFDWDHMDKTRGLLRNVCGQQLEHHRRRRSTASFTPRTSRR